MAEGGNWITNRDGKRIFISDSRGSGGAQRSPAVTAVKPTGYAPLSSSKIGTPGPGEMRHPDAAGMVTRMSNLDRQREEKRAELSSRVEELDNQLEHMAAARQKYVVSSPKRAPAAAEIELINESLALHQQINQLDSEFRQQALDQVIGVNDPASGLGLTDERSNSGTRMSVGEIDRTMETARTMIGDSGKPLPDIQLRDVEAQVGLDRSYVRDGNIHLRSTAGPDVLVHEVGHVLEYHDPSVLQSSLAFLDRRTAGKPLQSMSELTGDPGFKDYERGRDGGFIHPYVGKDYGRKATEVMSMGLEEMHRDPIRFARADPDHFAHTYSVMHRHG